MDKGFIQVGQGSIRLLCALLNSLAIQMDIFQGDLRARRGNEIFFLWQDGSKVFLHPKIDFTKIDKKVATIEFFVNLFPQIFP